MRVDPSFWLSLFFAVVISVAIVTAYQWAWDTRLFPWAIGIPALLLALWQAVMDFTDSRKTDENGNRPRAQILDLMTDQSVPREVVRRRTVFGLGWIVGFTLSIWLAGVLIATPIFVFSYLWLEAKAWGPIAAAIAGLTTLFIWVLFDRIMHTAWPEAVVFRLLGFY